MLNTLGILNLISRLEIRKIITFSLKKKLKGLYVVFIYYKT